MKKSNLIARFNTFGSGLLFWATLYKV